VRMILLVEDDPDDVALIQRAFQRAGSTAPMNVVQDGEEAVAYLSGTGEYGDRASHPMPVLVLLDLKLPRRSGLDVLRWLRAEPALRRLPVVVLTSSRESADVGKAYDCGANSYLVKPVSPDQTRQLAHALGLYWLQLNEPPPMR
jgi:CheY-like chemotaxis protein